MTDTATVEPGSTGLLDNVQLNDETQLASTQAVEIDHKAVPADAPAPDESLERPEYWPENFWKKDSNEPDLEGIAKSWSDLRKQISQGKHKAPADGKYDLKAFGEAAETNPIASTLSSWAKDNGLSQGAFDNLVENLQTQSKELMQGDMVDAAAEMKKLGPNGPAIVNGVTDWARGMINKGVLSADDFEEFKIMGGTARAISILMKIRDQNEHRVPTESVQLEGRMTQQDLMSKMNDPRWKTDPSYRLPIEKRWTAENPG